MKSLIIILATASALASTAAHAMTVSNIDQKSHVVVFESTPGSKMLRTINPGTSINILQTSGEVYIEGNPNHLRPDANDLMVIWPEGNLQVQKRRKVGGGGIF